jgi:DNA-binding response OmpR family regulator
VSLFLLLVEDNFDLAETLVQYLELEGMTCDHAASAEAGLNLASENEYDLLLLDISLPRMSGLELCEALRKEGRETPVLMLTAKDTLDDKLAGFKSGTDDYLVKPFDMPELVARINTLARRRSGQAKVLGAGDLKLHLDTHRAFRGDRELTLTPTGWKLLDTLVRSSPGIVSRQKLIQAVWGDEVPESNSLKVHLHKLRRQVDGENDAPLLHTIPGLGYALRSQHENVS